MADLFYTILIVWVLWRIFGGTARTTVYHKHQYEKPEKAEGEVTITSSSSSGRKKQADEGEYVDFEEVK